MFLMDSYVKRRLQLVRMSRATHSTTYFFITGGLALVIGLALFTSSLGYFGTSALHLGTLNSALHLGTSAHHLGVVTFSAGVALASVDRYCGSGTAVIFTLLGIARGAAGANAVAWCEAPLSPPPWSATHGHAAVILQDATAVSLQGTNGVLTTKSVFAIAPGATTLVEVTADAGAGYLSGHCAVRLPTTDVIVIIVTNAAWRARRERDEARGYAEL